MDRGLLLVAHGVQLGQVEQVAHDLAADHEIDVGADQHPAEIVAGQGLLGRQVVVPRQGSVHVAPPDLHQDQFLVLELFHQALQFLEGHPDRLQVEGEQDVAGWETEQSVAQVEEKLGQGAC